jgi:hypothetical protein
VRAAVEADQVSVETIQAVEEDLPVRIHFHSPDGAQKPSPVSWSTTLRPSHSAWNQNHRNRPDAKRAALLQRRRLQGRPYIAGFIRNEGIEIKLVDPSDRDGDSDSMPSGYLGAWYSNLPPELGTSQTATSTAMGQ